MVAGYCLLFVFVISNLILSQIVSPLYFQLVRPERKTAVEFLKRVKPLPLFDEKLAVYEISYGPGLEEEVFADDKQRDHLINRLEQVLSSNPSQRDVLYSLYLLYSDKGDLNTSNAYFQLAKELDPSL